MAHSYQYVAKASVVSCDLDGGSVLLDLETSQYFGLNAVGLVVWEVLNSTASADDIVEVICERFDVPADRCLDDVNSLIDQLLERQLIERYVRPVE